MTDVFVDALTQQLGADKVLTAIRRRTWGRFARWRRDCGVNVEAPSL